jgi:hypothetical protein
MIVFPITFPRSPALVSSSVGTNVNNAPDRP